MQHVFGFRRKQNPALHELLHESLFPCSGGRGKSWITHKVSDVFMRLSESLHQGLLVVFDAEIQHAKSFVGSMAYFSTISFLSQIHPNLYLTRSEGGPSTATEALLSRRSCLSSWYNWGAWWIWLKNEIQSGFLDQITELRLWDCMFNWTQFNFFHPGPTLQKLSSFQIVPRFHYHLSCFADKRYIFWPFLTHVNLWILEIDIWCHPGGAASLWMKCTKRRIQRDSCIRLEPQKFGDHNVIITSLRLPGINIYKWCLYT